MGRWWRRRRDATTARGLWPRNGAATPPAVDVIRRSLGDGDLGLRAAPGGQLGGGLIVDASIVAHLLGLRLLTLDARIRFVPAHVTTTGPTSLPGGQRPDNPSALLGDPGSGHRWPSSPASTQSGGLDDAVGLLADATHTLDQVRRGLSASLSTHD